MVQGRRPGFVVSNETRNKMSETMKKKMQETDLRQRIGAGVREAWKRRKNIVVKTMDA